MPGKVGFAKLRAGEVSKLEGNDGEALIPVGERAKYKEVHDFIENVQDLSVEGEPETRLSLGDGVETRGQVTSGVCGLCQQDGVKQYIQTALSSLKINASNDAQRFFDKAVEHAEIAATSATHFGQEELFLCEYMLPSGTRWQALFAIKSKRLESRATGNVKFAVCVALFHDYCKLTDEYVFLPDHLDGDLKDMQLMWMKYKVVMKVEEQEAEFDKKVTAALAEMSPTNPLQDFELEF